MQTNASKKKTMWATKRDDIIFYSVMAFLPLTQFFLMYICVNFNSVLLAFKNVNPLNESAVFTFDNIIAAFETLASAEF